MQHKFLAWFKLARPPFHIVGVLPFILGTWLAFKFYETFNLMVFLLGCISVVFIMMATYFAGEYWDVEENKKALSIHHSRFAGGSRIIEQGIFDKKIALYSSVIMLVLAGITGLILVYWYEVGIWAIPLGIIGMIAGFFYSTKPIRWVGTGVGELWIAFCYGWLPVAVGFYLQTQTIDPIVHLISIPIGLSIFNVILLNEYPDYLADKEAGKNNMVVRLGKEKATFLYIIIAIGSWIAGLLSIPYGVPFTLLIIFAPIILMSSLIVRDLSKKQWNNMQRLERLMGMNLMVNVGITVSFIIAFIG